MRYLEGHSPLDSGTPVPHKDEFVGLTVCFTLLIGVIFICAGLYGRQRWLLFWGATTLVACGGYFAWSVLY